MQQISELSQAIPASKTETFTCPIHGDMVYETYRLPDGSWKAPYCPKCRALELEHTQLINRLKSENDTRAKELRQTFSTPLPLDYEFASFDTYLPESDEERKNIAVCRRFAERFMERELEREKAHEAQQHDWQTLNSIGLFFQGNYGSGKTHLAYSILKRLQADGMTGFYITIPDLFDRLSDRVNVIDLPKMMAKLTMVTCLVLDEIGVQSGSEYEKKRLFQIIDGRIKNGRPTILISNLDRDELKALLTPRVMSRIKASVYPLTFTGRSRRIEVANNKAEDIF